MVKQQAWPTVAFKLVTLGSCPGDEGGEAVTGWAQAQTSAGRDPVLICNETTAEQDSSSCKRGGGARQNKTQAQKQTWPGLSQQGTVHFCPQTGSTPLPCFALPSVSSERAQPLPGGSSGYEDERNHPPQPPPCKYDSHAKDPVLPISPLSLSLSSPKCKYIGQTWPACLL